MFRISEQLDIDSPADEVWKHLSDFSAYPKWNPYLVAFTTTRTPGTPITLTLVQANYAKPLTIRPVLDVLDDRSREVRWKGRLLIPGLLDTEHFVRIERRGDAQCRVIQQEKFSGLFASLLPSSARRATALAFRAMNRALKMLAEEGEVA